jgi:prepilin-type N-terminal cleavage/methylation domain-containing protein
MGVLNRARAFTLVEVICVITIVAILTAITFPVMQQSMRGAKRVHAISNLKQLWIAFELYRQENEGEHLPGPNPYSQVGVSVAPKDLFPQCGGRHQCYLKYVKSPCSPHPHDVTPYMVHSIGGIGEGYEDPFSIHKPDLRDTLRIYGESHPAFIDLSCSDVSEKYLEPDSRKLGLSVLFNGTLVIRRGRGNAMQVSWWVSNPGE